VISVQADCPLLAGSDVPEGFAANVFPGKRVKTSASAPANRTAEGTVVVVSPAGDAASHKFVVKVALPAVLKSFVPGEFGRISFPVGSSKGVIVPEIALHDEGGLPTGVHCGQAKRREDAGC